MKFKNNDQAVHAVLEHLDRYRPIPERFYRRPFNQYSPEFTRWWLVPDTSWPAYKRGKLSFRRCPWNSSAIYIGYYSEKGFSPSIAKIAGVNLSVTLQSDWHWHRFLSDALHGNLDSAAAEVV